MGNNVLFCKMKYKLRRVIKIIDELFCSYSDSFKKKTDELNFHTKAVFSLFNENVKYPLLVYLWKDEIKNNFNTNEIVKDIIRDFIWVEHTSHLFEFNCDDNYLYFASPIFINNEPINKTIELLKNVEYDFRESNFIKTLMVEMPDVKLRISFNDDEFIN